jgi:hypothetical protein
VVIYRRIIGGKFKKRLSGEFFKELFSPTRQLSQILFATYREKVHPNIVSILLVLLSHQLLMRSSKTVFADRFESRLVVNTEVALEV